MTKYTPLSIDELTTAMFKVTLTLLEPIFTPMISKGLT
jgi:hypothetical protein